MRSLFLATIFICLMTGCVTSKKNSMDCPYRPDEWQVVTDSSYKVNNFKTDLELSASLKKLLEILKNTDSSTRAKLVTEFSRSTTKLNFKTKGVSKSTYEQFMIKRNDICAMWDIINNGKYLDEEARKYYTKRIMDMLSSIDPGENSQTSTQINSSVINNGINNGTMMSIGQLNIGDDGVSNNNLAIVRKFSKNGTEIYNFAPDKGIWTKPFIAGPIEEFDQDSFNFIVSTLGYTSGGVFFNKEVDGKIITFRGMHLFEIAKSKVGINAVFLKIPSYILYGDAASDNHFLIKKENLASIPISNTGL